MDIRNKEDGRKDIMDVRNKDGRKDIMDVKNKGWKEGYNGCKEQRMEGRI
jgi:hypothetical protein